MRHFCAIFAPSNSVRHQEGRDEGLKEGLERGHTEGRREGIQEGRLEVAKNLLALNMPLEQIVFVSGLTEDQVRELMQ